MYAQTDSDSHIKSRQRILVNQATFWRATYPQLEKLGFDITPDSAELICTIYAEHIKTFHPLAATVPLASMYEHLLSSGQADQLGEGPRKTLVEMYIARGIAARALPHLAESDPMRQQIAELMDQNTQALGRSSTDRQVKGAKRGHSLQLYLEAHPQLIQNKTVLHVAPEPQITAFFEQAQATQGCVYRPVEGMRPGHMEHHDLCELDIEDGSIDTILCHHVLEHIVDDRRAIKEMFRVLKPGGVLNFSVPQAFYLEHTADWAIPDHSFHGHVRTYGRDLMDRVAEPGFSVQEEDWLLKQPFEVMEKARALYLRLYNASKP